MCILTRQIFICHYFIKFYLNSIEFIKFNIDECLLFFYNEFVNNFLFISVWEWVCSMSKAIKAKDLAQLLGVSPATVSMVLNNRPGISEATRKLVFDKITELGAASSTYVYKPKTIDFIYFVIYKKHGKVVGDTPFFSQLIEGIEQSCKTSGYNLQIAYFNEGSDLASVLPLIQSKECRGLLLLATEMSQVDAALFESLECPTVLLDSAFDEISLDTVVINNRQAAGCATRYLIQNGHTSIGYLHSAFHINNFSERKDGYHRELLRNGLTIPYEYEFKLTPTVDGAYSDMKNILARQTNLPTAFLADNDIIALSAMRAFKEKGYKIPEDISIIGIDDMPMCELMDPPLTTMHVPKHQMGVQAVKRLIEKINQQEEEVLTIQIRTTLTERQSIRNFIGQ